eukprot:SAG31_NODE_1894_length_6965_cov_26.137198_4_plen_148_part_00
MMVIYPTPPLLFVALLPPNLNAAPILMRTRALHQNPTVWCDQDKHLSMLSTHFCQISSLQHAQTRPQTRAQNHQKGLQPATCVPPTCANQHQQTEKGKFDAELMSSDSCWCRLLPGFVLFAHRTSPYKAANTPTSLVRHPEQLPART